MKQILVMIAAAVLVGCGEKEPEQQDRNTGDMDVKIEITDPLIKGKIYRALKIPYGEFASPVELTEADLEKAIELNLSSTQITDAGLKEVAKLQSLTVLHLSQTQITDAGLKEVAKLQKLGFLNLSHTQITDEGLREVAKLQKLQWLDLSDTEITEEGVTELKKALPICRILFLQTRGLFSFPE